MYTFNYYRNIIGGYYMKKCVNCGAIQETGNFCRTCGGTMVAQTQQEAPTTPQNDNERDQQKWQAEQQQLQQQAKQQFTTVQNKSKMFLGYFIETLKRPSSAMQQSEKAFTYAIINIVIGIIIATLIFNATVFPYGSVVDNFISHILYVIVFFALPLIALLLTLLISGSKINVKRIITMYGAHFSFINLLLVFFFLTTKLDSAKLVGFTYTFLVFALCFATTHAIIALVNQVSPAKFDLFYVYVIFIFFLTLFFSLYMSYVIEEVISSNWLYILRETLFNEWLEDMFNDFY